MAKLSLKVSLEPCGHWLELDGIVRNYNVTFPVPDFCPRCGVFDIIIAKVHDAEYTENQLDVLNKAWR